MTTRSTFFSSAALLAACLVLSCSGKGAAGCGGGSAEPPPLGPEPYGIYKATRIQNSVGTCDQLAGSTQQLSYLVLYSFAPSDKSTKSRLGGTFCGDVSSCRGLAEEALEPPIGYSFLTYEDASGWQGWGISNSGRVEDQCKADVQSHVLTSTAAGAIKIETRTTETLFPPILEGETATCHNRAAIEATTAELPCKALLVVEATFEAGL